MHINSRVGSLFDSVIDAVGIRAGLALTESRLQHVLSSVNPVGSDYWWSRPTGSWVRVEAGALEQLVVDAMYAVGAISTRFSPEALLTQFVRDNLMRIKRPPNEHLKRVAIGDPEAEERYPSPATRIYQYVLWGQNEMLAGRIPPGFEPIAEQYRLRSLLCEVDLKTGRSWDGILPLDLLFDLKDRSGGISADSRSATLMDQRFIDYLQAQPADLEQMDWRQFEYLCGEYFRRMGYEVRVTPPSGDGGVDVIATRPEEAVGPTTVLVQAKRLSGKRQVDINTVKALWADVFDSDPNTRGLITTTTRLAKGAREYAEARKYRLNAAEREQVDQWIKGLATNPERE